VRLLLVDIGNSRIKWARLAGGRIGTQRAASHEGWLARDFERAVFARERKFDRILVASVAGTRVDRAFAKAAQRATGRAPTFVASARSAGGVTTRYAEPWRLGVDRFVATIGAFAMSRGKAACVFDIGTAMTIDLVDARGVHRGGAIVPGPELMLESLLRDTSGIARRARGVRPGRSLFATNTRAAIEQGARFATAAAIDRAVTEAGRLIGSKPVVYLTGGDAPSVRPLVKCAHRHVPALVLRGLAVLAATRLT
jgi:type III pantothenate kinase